MPVNPRNLDDAAAYALELCDRIAAQTDVPGTTTRLFLSPATRAVQALLTHEMHALGMRVRLDGAGNLRAVYPARADSAPTLLLGSHIDTVPDAGRFDGVLGVALPLALLTMLAPRSLPFHVEIVAFSEEEGIRFRTPFIGSRALAGTLTGDVLERCDAQGISVTQALAAFGVSQRDDTAFTPGTFAFVEVHIEQGPVLDALALPLGIVETIVGQTRLELIFTGQSNHAGTTPMPLRRDALAAAAAFIVAVETHAVEQANATPGLVATVGAIEAQPGAPNIIAGHVKLSLDIRHADDCTRLRFRRLCTSEARRIAHARGVEVRVRQTSQQASVPMDAALTASLARAVETAGCTPHPMPSGAGHDAMILAPHVPTAMLFLRTPAGLSHHPAEAVSAGDVQAAIATLAHLLPLLAAQMNHAKLS